MVASLKKRGEPRKAKAKASRLKSLQEGLDKAEMGMGTAQLERTAAEEAARSARRALEEARQRETTVRFELRQQAWRQRVGPRVGGYGEARQLAKELLTTKGGHRDRKSGAFSLPEGDTAEPARTERILASPFVCCRRRPGDAFQGEERPYPPPPFLLLPPSPPLPFSSSPLTRIPPAPSLSLLLSLTLPLLPPNSAVVCALAAREGFLLFRVNGSSRVGVSYRVLVLLINVLFGVLSGLSPLLKKGTVWAFGQTGCVFTLQIAMGLLCCCWLPDADRVVSRIAGIQFFAEGACASTSGTRMRAHARVDAPPPPALSNSLPKRLILTVCPLPALFVSFEQPPRQAPCSARASWMTPSRPPGPPPPL